MCIVMSIGQKSNPIVRRLALASLLVVTLYVSIGLAFHVGGKSVSAACRAVREARGDFVEPEVFGGVVGLALGVPFWPLHVWANLYHFGRVFPTPCD